MAMAPDSLPVAGAWMTIGFTLIFAGTGWALMLRRRLDDYRDHILDVVAVDEETTTTFGEAAAYAPRHIRKENGETAVIMDEDAAGISSANWRKLAMAIITAERNISKGTLARNPETKVISQPVYDKFFAYMNREGLLIQVEGSNELTNAGINFLAGYLPPASPAAVLGY